MRMLHWMVTLRRVNVQTVTMIVHIMCWQHCHETHTSRQGHTQDFHLGGGARPKGNSEGGILAEGQQPPPHQLGDLGECCELLQRGSGQSPNRPKVYHYFQH